MCKEILFIEPNANASFGVHLNNYVGDNLNFTCRYENPKPSNSNFLDDLEDESNSYTLNWIIPNNGLDI